MPPVIIAAAIGLAASAAAAAGYMAISVALAITIAASVGAALLTKAPAFGGYTSQQERKQVLRTSTAPAVTIYGRCVVSGLLFFAEEQQGSQEKEWIHLAICLADHEIDAVEQIWLGDDLISSYGNLVSYEIHSGRTTPDPFMLANCASWSGDMIGKGITWARISLRFDQDKFPAGLPNIKFQVRGKKVYDPRDGSTSWKNNCALCILDYYRSHLEVPDSDINMSMFIQAANICDQVVNTGGGERLRYTCNGTFDADESQATVLDDLHKACAGEPTYMAGKHGMLAGAYYGPATMDLYSSQIIDDIKITPETAFGEKLNTVTGTFLDPEQQYTEVDYPPVSVAQYVAEDGGEYTDDLKLRFVDNEYQAQQLAQIKINRTRVGRTLKFKVNLSGYSYRPGYYVNLYVPEIGISGVEHRIVDWSIAATDGVELTLRQETAAVWGDSIGNPIDRPDITDFPSVGVPQPTNLTFVPTEIGEIVQGVFSWENTGLYNYNLVFIRKDGSLINTFQIPGQSMVVNGLPRGNYVLSVAAVGFMGNRSAEAILPVSITAPLPPTGCEVIQQFFGFTLKPKVGEIYNVSTQFDFWTSGETQLPDSSTLTVEAQATRKGIGRIMSDSELLNDHTYYWYIRAVNVYGASEFLEVEALCYTDITELMPQIDEAIRDSDAMKNVINGVDTNLESILSNTLANHGTVEHQWAQVGDLTSAVNQKLTAEVNIDGTAKASYVTNLGIIRNGVKYNTGFGMSIEPSGDSYKSTVVFAADQFGIYSGSDPGNYQLAFVVYNGQVFMNEAFIRDASITNAKIADATITGAKIANATIDMAKISDTIQSTNFSVTRKTGWQLNKTGDSVFYGTVYASRIEGDLSVTYAMPPLYLTGLSGSGSRTVTWAGGVDFDVRISIPFFQFKIVSAGGVFRARVTVGGQVISGLGFTNGWFQSDQTISLGTTGYADIPANAVNVPITVEWGVAPGSSKLNAALMFSGMSIIVSPKRDRFT